MTSAMGATRSPAAEDNIAVEIRGLDFTVTDRRGARMPVMRGVSLRLRRGEFVSIVGPSGCGKSTLLNFVAGLLPAPAGAVTVAADAARAIGYMFQSDALLPWRSVQRNVELGLEVAGLPARTRSERARDIIARVGLAEFSQHHPAELSGGMRQRAALARTLVADPRLILMDEPFGALDAQTKLFIQELFVRTWEADRKTVLFVTHDLAEAISLSDRILVMGARPGRIIAEHVVDLPRPRDIQRLHNLPRFNMLLDSLWSHLRQEADPAMGGAA